jgi:hypothetical protein
LQISPRFPGGGDEAFLSPFITGTTVFDPFSGQVRTLNDLGRRKQDLLALVCGVEAPPVQQPPVQQPPVLQPPVLQPSSGPNAPQIPLIR